MMPKRRKSALPGSFTPRIRIYETIDLIRIDQDYPILCSDPSDVQAGDEVAFFRPEFTPFARSTYVKDDLIEAKVTQIARGVAMLEYGFLNRQAVAPLQGDEKWKGMRPATMAKVWCKRRRRPQEDRDDTFLDLEDLPFAVERIDAPLPQPEPRHPMPDALAHVIEDARLILATAGPEGNLPVGVLRDMLAALGPVSPKADLSGGHARRVGLSLMLVHRACRGLGSNGT